MNVYEIRRRSKTFLDSVESEGGSWLGSSYPSDAQIEASSFWVDVKSGQYPWQDVLGSFSNDLVVSSRFRDLLWTHLIPDFIRAIPLSVRYKGEDVKDPYFVIHEYDKWCDVANAEFSVPEYAGKVLVGYTALVVSRQKLPEFDLIPIEPCQWLVTERIAEIIADKNMTGLELKQFVVDDL